MELPAKIKPFLSKGKRYKIIIGGRGSAKSMSVADICLMDAMTKGIKTGCFREHQTSIKTLFTLYLGRRLNDTTCKGSKCRTAQSFTKGKKPSSSGGWQETLKALSQCMASQSSGRRKLRQPALSH